MYDKTIKDILNINDISQIRNNYNYLYNNLKTLGEKKRSIKYKSRIYIKIKT